MHAVRLAAEAQVPLQELTLLIHDPHPKVQLAVATAAGNWPTPESGAILGAILSQSKDSWIRAAALTSLNSHNVNVAVRTGLKTVQQGRDEPENTAAIARTLGQQAAALASHNELIELFEFAAGEPMVRLELWQLAAITGMLRGHRGTANHTEDLPAEKVNSLLNRAATLAAESAADDGLRAAAVQLLTVAGSIDRHLPLFASLLSARTSASLQTATIAATR
jgi:hypothetical protein